MANGDDRNEQEGGDGGSFVIGLLTGTVLGAGLGMLFAPKAGSELRGQLSEQADNLANTASEGYKKASGAASEWAGKSREAGREMFDRTKEAVNRGTEEARRYVREATGATTGSPMPSTVGGSSTSSSGSGDIRSSAPEETHGSQSHISQESSGPTGPNRSRRGLDG
jgi:gas vesicle protein